MTTDAMQLAVNHAISDMQLRRQRLGLINGGAGGGDEKRPKAWMEYGFPANITLPMLYTMWQRNGVAFGAVAKIVGNCWKTPPTVIEGATRMMTARKRRLTERCHCCLKNCAFGQCSKKRTHAVWPVNILCWCCDLQITCHLVSPSAKNANSWCR